MLPVMSGPDITGSPIGRTIAIGGGGALFFSAQESRLPLSEGPNTAYPFQFDARRSSSLYGNSETVQPPAVKLFPLIKI